MPGERIEARLRVADTSQLTQDVIVSADADHTAVALADPQGPATLETDAARPADPARICSRVGPQTLGRVRALLSGY